MKNEKIFLEIRKMCQNYIEIPYIYIYIYIYIFFFFLRQSFVLVTQTGMQWHNLGSPQPPPSGFKHSPASASRVAGTTGVHHHAQLIFVYLVDTGFHLVDQDGLDLLTS